MTTEESVVDYNLYQCQESTFLILKSSQVVMSMAVFASLIGVTLIGLYSWSIDGYQGLIADCELYSSNSTVNNSTMVNNSTVGLEEVYPDIFSPLKICE
ncbi:hypothetical protein OUZ56_022990 [Daphnia magna]|uniref:Uncharacterized protein n=1 Tax=Daphnia magna TaxID=35525 RepID=A0ABR0AY47_9CRUS|nr:hypothetical protein OUZ56_022990 [Daphnia magna]